MELSCVKWGFPKVNICNSRSEFLTGWPDGLVVAGFPNPLPYTLHSLFSWFVCVHVRVWSCVRVLARLYVPVLVALLVALTSRSTPVQWFRAHTHCTCAKYITIVIFPG